MYLWVHGGDQIVTFSWYDADCTSRKHIDWGHLLAARIGYMYTSFHTTYVLGKYTHLSAMLTSKYQTCIYNWDWN